MKSVFSRAKCLRSLAGAAACVSALALTFNQGAAAETRDISALEPSKAVSWKDLDLTNERDLQTLHARVRSAAILVCQDLILTGVPGWSPLANVRCIRDTYTTSIDRISQHLAATDPALAGRLLAGRLFAAKLTE